MTKEERAMLREAAEKATPGPWQWRQHKVSKEIDLAAPHGGGTIVMDFCRQGMHMAQPRFAVTLDDQPRGKRGGVLVPAKELIDRDSFNLLRHPDAEFIAASNPAIILSLLDALDGAERELEQWRNLSAKPSPEALAEGVAELYGKWQAARTQPPAQPEGWVCVPVEPTQTMVDAADKEAEKTSPWDLWRRLYRAMLAAAPQAPGADKGEALYQGPNPYPIWLSR